MKVSLIITVFNEEKSITPFLKSVLSQIKLPDELIIVDGGSTDKTLYEIERFSTSIKSKNNFKISVTTKKGNRSIGRNEAIRLAKNEIIAISDAGNILDRKWLKNITKPFDDKHVDVVAGYYKGIANNIFQKCLIPYVLVMPDRVDKDNFLPATRSMAIKKSIWKRVGGFDKKLSHNEDYAFANKLKKIKANIYFAKDAVVNWMPRQSLKSAFIMFFRFALGDMEAGIIRDKVILIFVRYLLLGYFFWLEYVYKSYFLGIAMLLGLTGYLIWSIIKNYKYVNKRKAYFYLPLIQILSDFAVMTGSIFGGIKFLFKINYLNLIKKNKYILLLLTIYCVIILSSVTWGLPNNTRPFTYHMDEWHFLGALKSVVKLGSGATEGGAYGPIFYSVVSAIFLIPFVLLGIINPFSVNSSVTELIVQRHIFETLRLTTLIYGALSIIFMYKILKEFLTKNWVIGVLIFALNPLFILWSGYYKHEIAVTFWVTISIYLFLKYSTIPTQSNLIYASVAGALALATKLSALPLLGALVVAYFIFSRNVVKRIKELIIGIFVFGFVFVVLGAPDVLLYYKTYIELLKPALFIGTQNLNLDLSWWQILFYLHYPSVFGYFTLVISLIGIIFSIYLLIKNAIKNKFNNYKIILFFLSSFSFLCLGLAMGVLGASNSRVLILLPFMAIFVNIIFDYLYNNRRLKHILLIIFIFGFLLQIIQTLSWLNLKYQIPVQEISSKWLVNNIPKNTLIGLENIPIYQAIPDIVLLEFYKGQRSISDNYLFKYEVIDAQTKILPRVLIITGGDLEDKYIKTSSKKELVRRLNREKYVKIQNFSLNYKLYDLFSDRLNLLYWNLVPGPSEISIYRK